MKYIALALIAAASLAGCETTDSEGNVTRFDPKAATDLINAGFNTYNQYQRASHIIGYDQLGNPIYGQ